MNPNQKREHGLAIRGLPPFVNCLVRLTVLCVQRKPRMENGNEVSRTLTAVLRYEWKRKGLHTSHDGFASVHNVIGIAAVYRLFESSFRKDGTPRFDICEEVGGPSIRATRR